MVLVGSRCCLLMVLVCSHGSFVGGWHGRSLSLVFIRGRGCCCVVVRGSGGMSLPLSVYLPHAGSAQYLLDTNRFSGCKSCSKSTVLRISNSCDWGGKWPNLSWCMILQLEFCVNEATVGSQMCTLGTIWSILLIWLFSSDKSGQNASKTCIPNVCAVDAWQDAYITHVLWSMCSDLNIGSLFLNLANFLSMVKKVLSDAVKCIKQCHANQYQVSQAVAFYSEGLSGYREKKSIWDVALEFSVDPSTLSRHVRGKGMSMLKFNWKKQKLTVTEEKVLVTFILESANIGFPLSHHKIEHYTKTVLESKHGASYEPVGKWWVFNFIDWPHEKLQTRWSKPLDTQCAKSLNPLLWNHGLKLWKILLLSLVSGRRIYMEWTRVVFWGPTWGRKGL